MALMADGTNRDGTLVVGADGTVGAALLRVLRASGERAWGTTRRPGAATPERPWLDLADAPERWSLPHGMQAAVVCAGATLIGACAADPQGTSLVNVEYVPRLVEACIKRGAFVVLLSTNQVFDGTRPMRRPTEPYGPINEYGRQKCEAERRVAAFREDVAVLRLTKVLRAADPLFATWRASLARGERIRPYADLWVAPVPLSTVVTAVRLLVADRAAGVWHLSGERDVSYEEAARIGARALGADERLVEPQLGGPVPDRMPRHTSLDSEGLRRRFGLSAPPVEWSLARAFDEPGALEPPSLSEVAR